MANAVAVGTTTNLGAGSGFTAAQAVTRALRRLDDITYEDSSSTDPSTSTTAFTVASDATERYEVGDTIDWTANGTFEAATVSAVASTTLTVLRAAYGTTAGDHAANAVFRRNPRFLSHVVNEAVTEALNSLWPDIFVMRETTYTVSSTTGNYFELESATEEVLGAYQVAGTSPDSVIYPTRHGSRPARVHTGFATSGLYTTVEGYDSTATTLRILTSRQPTISLLTSAQQDLVIYEACANLIEEFSHRPKVEGDKDVFNEAQKVQIFRGKARELRSKERQRLQNFEPERYRLTYRHGHHYSAV